MVREIQIQLVDVPALDEYFKLDINVPSEFVHLNTNLHVFKSIDLPQYIFIGDTIAETAENMWEYFTAFYENYAFIEVVQEVDGVRIIITSYEVETSTLEQSPTEAIIITHTTTRENPEEELYLDGYIL